MSPPKTPTPKPAKAKPRAKPLLVAGTDTVTSAPDLAQMEAALTEFASQQAPMVSRSSLARQQMEAEVSGLEHELAGVLQRKALVKRVYEAAMIGFEAEEADINRAIGLRTGGLTSDAMKAA